MEFLKATQSDVPEIMAHYKDVIKNTFTTWDENYPNENLVRTDIDDGNFYVPDLELHFKLPKKVQ